MNVRNRSLDAGYSSPVNEDRAVTRTEFPKLLGGKPRLPRCRSPLIVNRAATAPVWLCVPTSVLKTENQSHSVLISVFIGY